MGLIANQFPFLSTRMLMRPVYHGNIFDNLICFEIIFFFTFVLLHVIGYFTHNIAHRCHFMVGTMDMPRGSRISSFTAASKKSMRHVFWTMDVEKWRRLSPSSKKPCCPSSIRCSLLYEELPPLSKVKSLTQ